MKKFTTRDLLQKIERIAKSKIAEQQVVSLNDFRGAKRKPDPKCILIIEDDETMRSSLKRILETDGYGVKMAADATQLSTVLDDSPIDLILLDVGLPWINGFELAELMRDHRDLQKLPLVFISGQTSEGDVRKAFDLGASDYIKKPFDVEKVRKTIKTLLKINE